MNSRTALISEALRASADGENRGRRRRRRLKYLESLPVQTAVVILARPVFAIPCSQRAVWCREVVTACHVSPYALMPLPPVLPESLSPEKVYSGCPL